MHNTIHITSQRDAEVVDIMDEENRVQIIEGMALGRNEVSETGVHAGCLDLCCRSIVPLEMCSIQLAHPDHCSYYQPSWHSSRLPVRVVASLKNLFERKGTSGPTGGGTDAPPLVQSTGPLLFKLKSWCPNIALATAFMAQ